jgi:hypothetical protein
MLDGNVILPISYLSYVHIGILSNQEYKYHKSKMLNRLFIFKHLHVYVVGR